MEKWKTSITDVSEGKLNLRGYHISEMIAKLTYAETVFLILKGEISDREEF